MMPKNDKILSVVVVAYNEEEHIAQCIDSILQQITSYAYHVIVVDDGSTDQTADILNSYQDLIQIIHTKNQGPSHARNLAIQSTQSPWLAFFDADAVLDEHCIETLLVQALTLTKDNTRSFSVGGKQSVSPKAQNCEKNTAQFLQSLSFASDYLHEAEDLQRVNHVPSCNVIYSTKSLQAVRGFDERLWPCEDLDLDIRLTKVLDHQVFYCPKANIFHRRPKTYWSLLRMFYRYGFGHGLLVKKHGLCQKIHALPILSLILIMLLGICMFQSFCSSLLIVLGICLFNFIFWLLIRKQLKEAVLFSCLLMMCIPVWNFGFASAMFANKTRFAHD
ncbi:glycosyltransferase [bacterium]|nr:glycosyltransferase [bacterium]